MAETEKAGKKIWIAVAGVVIGTALTWYFLPWLWASVLIPSAKGIGRFFAAIGHHLASSATLPWWLLWILILLAVLVIMRVAVHVRRQSTPQNLPRTLQRDDFWTLNYEGLRWIWKYQFNGSLFDIVALCPVCSYQLDVRHDARPNPHSMIGLSDVTIYWCDHCQVVKAQLDGNERAITVRVNKEVLRLFNSGEWENVVRQQLTARSPQEAQR